MSTDDSITFNEFDLHERLLLALDKQGFITPTPVQEATIPIAMAGQDLMVSAKTGSGKTAAYVLPVLDRLLAKNPRDTGTRALILVPTRELARQVFKQVKALSSLTQLKTGLIMGGEDYKYQLVILRDNPEIIIATPGRFLEHMDKGATDLSDLEVLVIDEADRMLDLGFTDDVLKIAEHCNIERQTLFYSATLKQRQITRMTEQILSSPERVILETVRDQNTNIRQQYILADDDKHKQRLLLWLLANESFNKALVFTNSRESTAELGQFLSGHNGNVSFLHGELDQKDRNRILQNFRTGSTKVLVATDVASRGLDIEGVDLVVNFHMARNGDDYVHRIGRTGRAGETGLAIALISHNEWNLKAAISRYIRADLEPRVIKSLEGVYKGPKKVKSNGKAAGTKKKKSKEDGKSAKPKVRAKRTKDKGRGPKAPKNTAESKPELTRDEIHGFTALKKKPRKFIE